MSLDDLRALEKRLREAAKNPPKVSETQRRVQDSVSSMRPTTDSRGRRRAVVYGRGMKVRVEQARQDMINKATREVRDQAKRDLGAQ